MEFIRIEKDISGFVRMPVCAEATAEILKFWKPKTEKVHLVFMHWPKIQAAESGSLLLMTLNVLDGCKMSRSTT